MMDNLFQTKIMPLRFNSLLLVYLTVPLSVLFIFVDLFIFDGHVRSTLPITPEKTPWYVILFGLPHIVASELTFVRKDYLNQYKSLLFRMIIIALISAILINYFFNRQIGYAIIAIWTMIHVIGQQVGLCRVNLMSTNWSYHCWKWSLIASSCFTMLVLGTEQTIHDTPDALKIIALFTFIVSNFFFYFMILKSKNQIGYWYCLSTHMMVIISVLCFAIGYPFFAILIPRVVHDVTAFMFYTTHEYNYNQRYVSKGRALNKKLLSKFVSVPVIAILFAYIFNNYFPPVFILTLVLLHYLLESRIWQSNTPHRQNINFL